MCKSYVPSDTGYPAFVQHQRDPGRISPTSCCADSVLPPMLRWLFFRITNTNIYLLLTGCNIIAVISSSAHSTGKHGSLPQVLLQHLLMRTHGP